MAFKPSLYLYRRPFDATGYMLPVGQCPPGAGLLASSGGQREPRAGTPGRPRESRAGRMAGRC